MTDLIGCSFDARLKCVTPGFEGALKCNEGDTWIEIGGSGVNAISFHFIYLGRDDMRFHYAITASESVSQWAGLALGTSAGGRVGFTSDCPQSNYWKVDATVQGTSKRAMRFHLRDKNGLRIGGEDLSGGNLFPGANFGGSGWGVKCMNVSKGAVLEFEAFDVCRMD